MKLTRWKLVYIFLFIFLIFQTNMVLANNIVVPHEWYRYQGASDSDKKGNDCGPACVAMAIQFIKNTFVPIRDIRNYIGPNTATSEQLKNSLQHWGISCTHLSAGSQNVIDAVNNRNHIVICPVKMLCFSPGLDIDPESDDPALHYDRYCSFTEELQGHFIVVKGISDDGNWIIVYDPGVWGSYPYPKYWYSNGEPKGKERYYKLSEFSNAISSRGIEILAEPHPIITSPLKISPSSSYCIGDTINAEFTITNQGKLPIYFSVLTIGGRDPDNHVSDFTHRQNISLKPIESYDYKGSLTLNKVGNYHFFCTYQTPDGEWNANVDISSKLTDGDREEDIYVKEKEKASIVPETSEKINIEWDRSFEITDYQAQLKILENGDIQVNEIFEYDFDGDFNGIIRTIGIKGSDGLQYFKASEYFPIDKELNYDQSIKGDMVTYKIYDKSSNERKLFLLEYQLKNVITLYNDTAEFYWKFFDESNTSPIRYVKIEVELPGEVSKEELKVFGHGPLDGEVSIQEDGKILYEVYGLSSGEMAEVRILFPTSLISNSNKINNQNKFAEIMEEKSESIEALEEEDMEVSSSENYYPLDEGRIWEYQFLLKEGGGWYIGLDTETSGEEIITNFPQRKLKGEKVTPQQIEDKLWGSSYISFWFYIEDQSGVYEFAYQYPEDVEPKTIHDYIIKYPIKVGNIWQEIETSSFKPKISIPVKSTIESINEVVTVPAGTFEGCLKIKTIGFKEEVVGEWLTEEEKVRIDREWYKWFAPEVGLIKSIFKEMKTCTGGITSIPPPEYKEITRQLRTFK